MQIRPRLTSKTPCKRALYVQVVKLGGGFAGGPAVKSRFDVLPLSR